MKKIIVEIVVLLISFLSLIFIYAVIADALDFNITRIANFNLYLMLTSVINIIILMLILGITTFIKDENIKFYRIKLNIKGSMETVTYTTHATNKKEAINNLKAFYSDVDYVIINIIVK